MAQLKAGSTMDGKALAVLDVNNFADSIQSQMNLKDCGTITKVHGGTGGGTEDFDLTDGNSHSATVDTSTNTFTFSNPTAAPSLCIFTIVLTNGGSQTVNWPGSVTWVTGVAPTLLVSGVNVLLFFTIDGGTIWYGVSVK